MMVPSIHGVALIRVSQSAVRVDSEFYGVFWHGVLQPACYASWGEATAAFQRLHVRAA